MHGESPLVRQWLLLGALGSRPEGTTVKELMGELGVSEKTVRRDLECLGAAGFPLQETVGAHGRKTWRIDPAKARPGMTFTFDEALALYLARRFLEPLAGTAIWEAASRGLRKIRACLRPEALRYVDRFATLFHQTGVGQSNYAAKAECLDRLMIGIEDRKAVFITYQSLQATEPVTYDVYPYGLVRHGNSLYMVGHAPQHDQIRHWKIDRVQNVELTDFPFQPPEGFKLRDHLAKSFGIWEGHGDVCVKIRFSPAVARYVQEKRWHESQRLTPQPDGSLLAQFRLSSTEEIKSWVLSFGKEAEVLEPEELRGQVLIETKSTVARYQKWGEEVGQ